MGQRSQSRSLYHPIQNEGGIFEARASEGRMTIIRASRSFFLNKALLKVRALHIVSLCFIFCRKTEPRDILDSSVSCHHVVLELN